jgi:hypothetical protein
MAIDAIQMGPFAALTFIAAPALLTNASSLLLMSTTTRFARALDRTRFISNELIAAQLPDEATITLYRRQLVMAQQRVRLIAWSMTAFYVAVGAFALGTLGALLGASFAESAAAVLVRVAADAILASGVLGVGALVYGAALLVWESRLNLVMLRDEAAHALASVR